MLLGLVVVNVAGVPASAELPGIRFAVRYVLGLGIVLLGLRLNLASIAVIGGQAFGLVLQRSPAPSPSPFSSVAVCGVARAGRILDRDRMRGLRQLRHRAAAPVVKANDREVSFAVATITFFGTLAVFVLPVIGHALGLDVLTFGLWAGTAVPDTAQTIATSAAYSTRSAATWRPSSSSSATPARAAAASAGLGLEPLRRRSAFHEAAPQRAQGVPLLPRRLLGLALVRTARLVDPERSPTSTP